MKSITATTGLIFALASGVSHADPSPDSSGTSGSNTGYGQSSSHRVRSNTTGTDKSGSASSGGSVSNQSGGSVQNGASASDPSGASLGGHYPPSTGTGGTTGAAGSTGSAGGGR